MSKVYVVAAKRSALASFSGALANVSPADFGAQVLKQTLASGNIQGEWIDEVIIGHVLSAGQKQGLARQISVNAGVPVTVPAYTLNMVCGSGMKSVMNAYTSIKAGIHQMVVAGGIESMSQAPYLVNGYRTGIKMGHQTMQDHILHDALLDAFEGYHMGITAENIVEKYGFSREQQDKFAYNSQIKSMKAQDEGLFNDEIVPVVIKNKKGDIVFDKDEYINRNTSLEKISTLRPAFKGDGTVTAASSSGINDGASFMVIASEEAVKEHNLTPLFEIIGIGQGGVHPKVMGLGPTPAIKNAVKFAGIKFEDIDVLELNEAFAAQSMGVVRELSHEFGVKEEEIFEKTNPKGGAIALGHPLGASGNRILVTLVYDLLHNENYKIGLASLCIGGGMGTAVILKKI
ncbi:acetyl-CoA C-acetyltransferase [Acholeplasma hippikon]|uniref:acetyl-CoA C-acetyltransferase n=1 Tax=Acholeplasma hippikon TaxID=264636 RepID=A0A449BK63_9MOLU|nr:acetyl-CoA C-acetyltransferase [Acholeplasma hippikon]VEU82717.1 Acetyl-CoA acetyltransferase [Acholeplasma hippikon]